MQQQQHNQTEASRVSRLPVNPRRHKVAPEQRKRVATACNSCNVRRIKCSGEKPCRQCRGSARECVYPTVVEKVSVSRNDFDELRRRCEAAERALQLKVPDAAERQQLMQQELDPAGSRAGSSSSFTPPQQYQHHHPAQARRDGPSDAGTNDEEAETEGRLLADPDGKSRFLGETSGATFLDSLKEFMSTVVKLAVHQPNHTNGSTFLASLGRYQTNDSRPIYEDPNVNPFVLPSRTEMGEKLADLRHFIQDGGGSFPCGGIYWWGDLSSVPVEPNAAISQISPSARQEACDKYRHLAFYHTAFAVTSHAQTRAAHMPEPTNISHIYFARARMLLGNPLDITSWTISDVAVLALMGFYLIEVNRRDAAYMYVSNAMHISMMHGAHRGWVDERGKRVFWTLYILDRWLSCLMGRPPTISDDAIRLPLPCDSPSLPPAAGLRAHVELARISGHIVCNTYRVAPFDHRPGGAARHVERARSMLHNWLSSLPPALQMPADGSLSTDPACCLLHMAHNQLTLLLVRPFFFVAVRKAFAERWVANNRTWGPDPQDDRITACSEAARNNLRLARWLIEINNGRKLLQASLHNVFNAAIILMLEELLRSSPQQPPPSPSAEPDDVSFAIDVFEEEANTGSNYARDCATVMQDLRSLIQRLRQGPQLVPAAHIGGPGEAIMSAHDSNTPLDYQQNLHQQQTFPPGPGLQVNEGIWQEIATWLDPGDWQLYNNYQLI